MGRAANAWRGGAAGVERTHDFVATLGFTGVDYAAIDLACMYLGTVSVPLPRERPPRVSPPVIAETSPRLLATDIGSLDAAVERGPGVGLRRASGGLRLRPAGGRGTRGDRGGRKEAGRARRGGTAARGPGARGPAAGKPNRSENDDPDRLVGLIYTSGSTGTPKGAMYTSSMITRMWQHARGGLNAGGSGNAGANRAALHAHEPRQRTLLADQRARLRRHRLLHGPQRHVDAVRGHPSRPSHGAQSGAQDLRHGPPAVPAGGGPAGRAGTPRPEAEAGAATLVRDGMLGGRIVSALCGSAPLSDGMRSFTASLLGTPVIDCYGSTETTRPSWSTRCCATRR